MRKWAARIWLLLVGVVAVPFWLVAVLMALPVAFVTREPLQEFLSHASTHFAELCAEWLEAWHKAGADHGV